MGTKRYFASGAGVGIRTVHVFRNDHPLYRSGTFQMAGQRTMCSSRRSDITERETIATWTKKHEVDVGGSASTKYRGNHQHAQLIEDGRRLHPCTGLAMEGTEEVDHDRTGKVDTISHTIGHIVPLP